MFYPSLNTASSKTHSRDTSRKTFDHLGGELRIDHYDVTLTIPPGALEEGLKHDISVQVLTKLPDDLILEDNQMIINFGIHCTPAGLSFKKPITVSMPHCAVFTDPNCVKSVVFIQSGENSGKSS